MLKRFDLHMPSTTNTLESTHGHLNKMLKHNVPEMIKVLDFSHEEILNKNVVEKTLFFQFLEIYEIVREPLEIRQQGNQRFGDQMDIDD